MSASTSAAAAASPGATPRESDSAMMPPPTPGHARSSGRMIKPTLKLRDDQDDGEGSGEESGHGMRMRMKPSLRRPSAGSSMPGAVTAKSLRARRLRLNINQEQRIRGRGDPTYAGAKKTIPYMQGYDRELDSSDDEKGEGMAFEEHIVLRMPEGNETTKKLAEWVRRREAGSEGHEIELKFKDSRRAVFRVGDKLFSSRLVDLPAIIESHKTLDNKQLFKICDISQMLLVTHQVAEEADITKPNPEPIEGLADNFVYDHGITPPMRWARKRRFRKRVHKRTIETVENEVERLLAEDERAEKIEYKMIDLAEADLSDTDSDTGDRRRRRAARDSSVMDDGTSTLADGDDRSIYDDFDEASMMADDDDVDRDLQRELEEEMLLQQEEEEEDEDEDDDDDDDDVSSTEGARRRRRARSSSRATSEDDDDDDDDDEEDDLFDDGADDEGAQPGVETTEKNPDAPQDDDDDDDDLDEEEAEMRVREQQLEAECREIENMVKRKQAEVDSTANALIKQRNQASLKRIQAELEVRRTQLQDLKQQRRDGKAAAKAEAQAQAEEAAAAAAAAAVATEAVEPSPGPGPTAPVTDEGGAGSLTNSTESAPEKRTGKSSSTVTSSPGKRGGSAGGTGSKSKAGSAKVPSRVNDVDDAEVAHNDDDDDEEEEEGSEKEVNDEEEDEEDDEDGLF